MSAELEESGPISRCGSCRRDVRSLCRACLPHDEALAAAVKIAVQREREEIARLVEGLTKEYRVGPSEADPNGGSKAGLREVPHLTGAGLVEIPTNYPSPAEVWVLERAAARIRARGK